MVLLQVRFADLQRYSPRQAVVESSIASLFSNPTFLQRPAFAPIMSDPKLTSYLEEMKREFWHERRHLRQDEIKLQWAASAAPYASILLDTEAPLQPLELTPAQGQQMARQSTSNSWTEAAERRPSVCTRQDLPLPS